MVKVFIDTNVIKFSATEHLAVVPVNRWQRNWYGNFIGRHVSEVRRVNPNDKLPPGRLKDEVARLPDVKRCADAGMIELYQDIQSWMEGAGLPRISSASGRFWGAEIKRGHPPHSGIQVLMGPSWMGFLSPDKYAIRYLSGIRDKRFQRLQRATGAYQGKDEQGKDKLNANQLIDAYLLWSAETNGADYFLTLDFTLISTVSRSKLNDYRPTLVTPSELLSRLNTD